MKKFVLTFFLLASYLLQAQEVHPTSGEPLRYCGSTEATDALFKKYPFLKDAAEIIEQQQAQQKTTPETNNPPIYTIPIVFHILHAYGSENISDAQVKDEVRILNEDFRKLNADISQVAAAFTAIAADAEIEFKLAQLDPNGICTNGINRVATQLTFAADDNCKSLIMWPRSQYLNVWSVHDIGSGAAGYTYLPSSVAGSPSIDGIIIRHDYCGSIGTGSTTTSRALSHEIGHWFNLQHCWGSTNQPGVSCGNDGVNDTPVTKGWTTCNMSSNDVCTPGTQENVQNYMEYAYCQKMFTTDQCTKMRNALNSTIAQRNNLWTSANLAATGVSTSAQLCTADFSVNKRVTCIGSPVTFSDLSWNAPATSWQWDIDNDGTTDYTTQAPSHTYNTAGVYSVKLTVSDGVSTKSATKTSYIIVLGNTATAPPNYSEGFEATGFPYTDWYINLLTTGSAPTWSRTTAADYSGTASLTMNNYTSTQPYTEEAISPSIDLSNATGASLTFQVAYAQRNGSDADQLRLLVSTNCGANWSQRYSKYGASLSTAGIQGGSFTPSSTAQWRQETVSLASYVGNNNFRFKFEFKGDGGTGNNVYIDDINIAVTNSGVEEELANAFHLSVYPNPFDESTTISFTTLEKYNVSMGIYDVVGREVVALSDKTGLAAGTYTLPVNKTTLAPGVYFVKLIVDGSVVSKKIVVQ